VAHESGVAHRADIETALAALGQHGLSSGCCAVARLASDHQRRDDSSTKLYYYHCCRSCMKKQHMS
jgi:hypothetical protein